MSRLRRFASRILLSLRPSRAESELAREIDAHLQMLEDKFVGQGMTVRDARAAARREFHGVEQTKELQRDARGFRAIAGWKMDLKLGVRMLTKTPGLTAVGVFALAVAIGAGAAFLEFSSDLLDPALDVPGAERLVGVRAFNVEQRTNETQRIQDFAVWRHSARTLDLVGAHRNVGRDLVTADGMAEPVRGSEITASGFQMLPVSPLMGRALQPEDEHPSAPRVMVIGHDIWRTRFNSHPGVVGTTVRLGPVEHTIVGVMPAGFAFPASANVWVPLRSTTALHQIFGRLTPGVSVTAAQDELRSMYKPENAHVELRVAPYLESVVGEDRGSTEAMAFRSLNVVFVLLLMLCGANVATLVFARTAMREAEITVRTALGASRGRISAQLFAEGLVLSLLAAVAGLFAAKVVGDWAQGLYERGIGALPFWWHEGLGYTTIAYAFALAIVAALIVGIVPALKATGRNLQVRMREGASGTASLKFGGVWTAVIVTQTAVTVMFLAAVAGLTYSTLTKQRGSDVSYDRERLLTSRVVIDSPNADRVAAARGETMRALAAALATRPEVAGVSYATALPGTMFEQFHFEMQLPELQAGAEARRVADELWAHGAGVGEQFFETVGIPLVAGRLFTNAEIRQSAPVAIVDETFVRTALGGRSPIGVTLRRRAPGANGQPGPWLEIVGVVRDAGAGVRTGVDDAAIYRPAGQTEALQLFVRARDARPDIGRAIYAATVAASPELRLVDLRTAAKVAEEDALPQKIFLRAFSVISAIALLLAVAGIYALISFTLARRTREIGIRIAIGAAPRRIITGVFSRAFKQVGLGVAAALVPALLILQGLAGDDAGMTTLRAAALAVAVCAFVAVVALASCTVPLRRALNVDPIRALRAE